MNIKAIIYDLDNTVYAVPSVGEKMFRPLFQLIEDKGAYAKAMDEIKKDIMKIAFQLVSEKYGFDKELTDAGTEIMKNLTYNDPLEPFSDYKYARELPVDSYLVTKGFTKFQQSKIDCLGIEKDFKEVIIVDQSTSDKTKQDVFMEILQKNNYLPSEVIAVGDDTESEIKAAQDVSIKAIVYDRNNEFGNSFYERITRFNELADYVKKS